MNYHHLGVPVKEERAWAGYIADGKVHYSDPEQDPFRIEWLKFDADSPMPAELQNQYHIAFMVDDLEAALVGKEIFLGPFSPTEGVRCAFFRHQGVLVEFMCDKPAKTCGCGCG